MAKVKHHKLKDKIKQVKDNVKHGVITVKQGAKKIANEGKKHALLLLFGPMALLAGIFLKRRGITPSTNIEELVAQVITEKKKNGFGLADEGGDSFDYVHEQTAAIQNYGLIPVTPEMIAEAISFIKNIFQSIKDKKAKGEPLSADEQKVLDQAPAIEKSLEEAKNDAADADKLAANEAKSLGGMNWKIIAVVVLIIVILFFILKKL